MKECFENPFANDTSLDPDLSRLCTCAGVARFFRAKGNTSWSHDPENETVERFEQEVKNSTVRFCRREQRKQSRLNITCKTT